MEWPQPAGRQMPPAADAWAISEAAAMINTAKPSLTWGVVHSNAADAARTLPKSQFADSNDIDGVGCPSP